MMEKYIVTGMSCAACSSRVEGAVGSLDGVTSCSVNLLTGDMLVEGGATRAEVIAAVEAAGYGIRGGAEKSELQEDKSADREGKIILLRLIFSAIILLPLMYISMGIFLFTYSGLKQTIAMAFVMAAAIGIFEDRPKKFVFWTLVATLFHMPAAIFIIAYPIAKKKIDRYYVLLLVIAMVCVFWFRDQIVGFFSEAYYEDETKYYAKKTIGGRALMMALFILAGLMLRPAQRGDKIYSQVVNLMVIAAVIQSFSVYDNVFTRLADYYYQFVVLHMPLMLESSDHQLKMGAPYRVRRFTLRSYRAAWFAITLFALWFYNNTVSGGGATIADYKFFWEINPYALYGS